MSLPDEMLDELLSGYLDGVLSGDECARVEQLLSDDANVTHRLEVLRERSALASAAALPVPRLPKQFAESVVQAAIETAQAEQLSADHPLMLAAHASSATLREGSDRPSRKSVANRFIGLVAGLAASVLFVGFWLNHRDESVVVQPIAPLASLNIGQGQQTAPLATSNTPELPTSETSETTTQIASAEVTPGSTLERAESFETGSVETMASPLLDQVADSGRSEPVVLEPAVPEPMIEEVVSQDPPFATPIGSERAALPQLASLMVVEVRLTDAGRIADAFDEALSAAEIGLGETQQINDTLASAVEQSDRKNDRDNASPGRIVLLEAPAKTLDKLVNQLVSDTNAVESIGFSLITEKAILKGIDSVRGLDPTTVRHTGRSWPLEGETSEVFDGWKNQVGGRGFVPLANGMGISQAMTGPNPIASLLILVR